ncbi:twin-arginine translocase TatA/TatE family subunit [Streptomyces sp. NPDC004284]|uniref:twin-arginine translocase TatA/TatE family subunit n=1 Tax=Streptomyces sp. NPDC004284 TaxID=3364695 RepID=UPI003683667D
MFGISEIAIVLIVLILVLGAKKLPELARSAGKSARILKSEAKAMKADDTPHPQATYQVKETPGTERG